jgi:hypothetical protein
MNESYILKAGFTLQKKASRYYCRIKELSKEPVFSLEDYYFEKECEEFSYELQGTIINKVLIFKIRTSKNLKKFVALLNFQEVITIKNAEDLLRFSADLNVDFGFVYIIKSGLGYKIGMTKSIHNRTRVFNVKLPIHWDFEKVYCLKDYKLLEKFLHSKFEHKKINGEWFNLSEEDLKLIEDFYNCIYLNEF